jgi:hypothetical protein
LDEDGYCLHHPDVQLAETCRKGGWNVLLDFCPGKTGERAIIFNFSSASVNHFTHLFCSSHL